MKQPSRLSFAEKTGAFIVWCILTILAKTWKFTFEGNQSYNLRTSKVDNACIYCFWHQNLIQFAYCYHHQAVTTIVSASKDGDVAAAIAGRWGHTFIRGSSSRRGFSALRETLRMLENNKKVVVIPDGPRGPFHTAKQGAAQLALLSKKPIIPMSAIPSSFWQLSSWDKFVIPKPFAGIRIIFHEAIDPACYANDSEGLEKITNLINTSLV